MITVSCIVKDEADRFLEDALKVWTQFADRIVAVDDGSTDETADILADYGAETHSRDVGLWGNESEARQFAWEQAVPGSEWVFILDADMVPGSIPHFQGLQTSFRLFDMWNSTQYREDAWWNAHNRLSVWAANVKDQQNRVWAWENRGIHADRMPVNLPGQPTEADTVLLHYAYSSAPLRAAKKAQYEAVSEHLSPREKFHASTITHPRPRLLNLPFKPEFSLL